jgi:hypothetical protein
MHLINGNIVDGGFGLAEKLEGAKGERASLGWERGVVKDFADGRQVVAVLMGMARRVLVVVRMFVIMGMRVIMIMRVGMVVRGVVVVVIAGRIGFVTIDEHASFARCDAAAVYGIEDESRGEIEGRGGLLEERGGDAGVNQGA